MSQQMLPNVLDKMSWEYKYSISTLNLLERLLKCWGHIAT